jgi:hypothetical protein
LDADPAFHFDADPDPAFHSDADPKPASQNDADPQHCRIGIGSGLFLQLDPDPDLH